MTDEYKGKFSVTYKCRCVACISVKGRDMREMAHNLNIAIAQISSIDCKDHAKYEVLEIKRDD